MAIATGTTMTVIGEVCDYRPKQGYGFATSHELPASSSKRSYILIPARNSRKVEGTSLCPVLTDFRDHRALSTKEPCSGRVLMDVIMTEKGWKALRWGDIPLEGWADALIRDGGLERFIGGKINICDWSESPRVLLRGSIKGVSLTPEALELTISPDPSPEQVGQPDQLLRTPALTIRQFNLTGDKVWPDYRIQEERMAINLPDERLVFIPHSGRQSAIRR
jgi:hypothetical protein